MDDDRIKAILREAESLTEEQKIALLAWLRAEAEETR